MKDLYLIGGRVHVVSCIDTIEAQKQFKIKGIFDFEDNFEKQVLGYPAIATDKDS
jgi:hypothetical protein